MPSLQQSFNLESIKNSGVTLQQLKVQLQNDDLKSVIYADHFYDIKDPDSPDSVLEICFSNMCGTYTPRLIEDMQKQAIRSVAAMSADIESVYHVYAVVLLDSELVIIDPSIGQYIKGYRDIFVGTRKNLRDLILSEETELNYIVQDRSRFFEKTWGNESMTAYAPASKSIIKVSSIV